jgi:DNA-binding Xre family transcriptional regulator
MTYLRVRELAEAKGMNITDLSRKALISYTTAHSLWHDRTDQLNRKTLDRVARALNVRVSDLFGGEPEADDVGVWMPALAVVA